MIDRYEPQDLSVVVCAYTENRWDYLLGAIDSLQSQRAPCREVILVVDHNESLLERARLQIPDVTVLANVGPHGASASRNTGVSAATGAVVAFIDDDAEVMPNWSTCICRALDDGSAGVGGSLLPEWEGRPPAWFPPALLWVVGCSYTGLPKKRDYVRNVIAANMLCRRDAFTSVGGFRAGFGKTDVRSGGEETELCIRITSATGKLWVYEPCARARHRVPASRMRVRYLIRRCWDEGWMKNQLSGIVASDSALFAEKRYLREVIPREVSDSIRRTLRGDPAGVAQAAVTLSGIAAAAAGFCAGRVAQFARRR